MTCKCSHPPIRLPRREAAKHIGEEEVTLDNLARKTNKRRKELPYHMVGNKAYYYIDDLNKYKNEYEKGKQTF